MVWLVEYINCLYEHLILHVTDVTKCKLGPTSQLELSALLSNVYYQEINM